MNRLKALLMILLAWGFMASLGAQGDKINFGYEIKENGGSTLILKITSNVTGKDMWVGVSLYKPNVKNTLEEGQHMVFPLKQGTFVKEISIEPEFVNGTFESAIWLRKLTGDDCPKDDIICQKFGYKLDGMAAYLWGYLVKP